MPGRARGMKDNAAAGPAPGAKDVAALDPGAPAGGPSAPEAPKHYHGHRDRLRARFRDSGADALQDYELLELLLFQAIPQKDVKPLAKALLAEFGSLWGVVNAPPDALRRHKMVKDAAVAALKVTAAIALRMARQDIVGKPVLGSWTKVMDYCTAAMAHEPIEQFRILFLDRKNTLIADEVQQRGTVDHTPVYPREVVKRALELHASALILVHNHPSGDPQPSRADIDMTKQIVAAASALGVAVHDHIIIGKGRHVSFKGTGLL